MMEKRPEITGYGLKLIAVITMLIDHIAVGLLLNLSPFQENIITMDYSNNYYRLYAIMRLVGRMAFPIYCFLLVEGFYHTRNIKKYAARLLTLAIASEVPFDLLFRGSVFDLTYNNVIWSLLLGLLTLCLIDYLKNAKYGALSKFIPCDCISYVLMALVLFGAMYLAKIANLDYSESGIITIVAMYACYGYTRRSHLISLSLGIVLLTVFSSTIELAAFVLLIPMFFYKGNQGTNTELSRRFFYLFYPVHIVILWIIRSVLLM